MTWYTRKSTRNDLLNRGRILNDESSQNSVSLRNSIKKYFSRPNSGEFLSNLQSDKRLKLEPDQRRRKRMRVGSEVMTLDESGE